MLFSLLLLGAILVWCFAVPLFAIGLPDKWAWPLVLLYLPVAVALLLALVAAAVASA